MPARDERFVRIYAAVSRVPRGRVATYGQIARLAGLPRRARLVGFALGATPDGVRIPWQRVISASGKISARAHPFGAAQQREKLESEGVLFGSGGRIPLRRFQWARGACPAPRR